LATAGTGDVLSGVIGAFIARGVPAQLAAGLAAHVHGAAAALGFDEGMVASDLVDLLPRWLSAARTESERGEPDVEGSVGPERYPGRPIRTGGI
jgi:NAD(P)H-hydrate epimerase